MAKKVFKSRGTRTDYPSDVSDEEWAFCASYLTLIQEDAPQRDYTLRGLFNALRYMIRAGCPWRMIPHDLREVLRVAAERTAQPCAVILDGRTLQSTPESGHRAGYDGYKRKKGSKVHAAVDTLGHLLALKVTPANEQERA